MHIINLAEPHCILYSQSVDAVPVEPHCVIVTVPNDFWPLLMNPTAFMNIPCTKTIGVSFVTVECTRSTSIVYPSSVVKKCSSAFKL